MFKNLFQSNLLKKQKTGSVFLFHNVGKDSEYTKHLKVTISDKRFKKIIKKIKDNYKVLPFSEFLAQQKNPDVCAITFDDGLKSFQSNALPILTEYNLPVKIFLNWEPLNGQLPWLNKLSYIIEEFPAVLSELTKEVIPNYPDSTAKKVKDYIDYFNYPLSYLKINELYERTKQNSNCKKSEILIVKELYLSLDDVKNLHTNSLIEWGSHTISHFPLNRLDSNTLRHEILECHNNLIANVPNKISGFALPFGTAETKKVEIAQVISNIDKYFLSCTKSEKDDFKIGNLPEISRIPIY